MLITVSLFDNVVVRLEPSGEGMELGSKVRVNPLTPSTRMKVLRLYASMQHVIAVFRRCTRPSGRPYLLYSSHF